MTGFGRAETVVNGRQIVVEIKSLNGKQFELTTKLPPIIRLYELDLRNILNSTLFRGSIEFVISVKMEGASKPMTINTGLAMFYYQGMKQIANQLNIGEDNILSTLMRMPEVVAPEQDVIPENEWKEIEKIVAAAAHNLMEHRKNEGAALAKELTARIGNIENALNSILPLEAQRTDKIRTRISQNLRDAIGVENVDPNRFEQELIFYIERIDFTEEKTRLKQHCNYFHSIIAKQDVMNGKKLGFILQEIGREINTLGAKANNADIQQIVIEMKDELEKAKEQVLNIL
jgi:uncharacterized protein (TIGR00255 family)